MAAVIRYLSADNHAADTRAFYSPETGRHSATESKSMKWVSPSRRFCANSFVCTLKCVGTGIVVRATASVQRNSFCPGIHIYIYIAFTCSV